MTNDRRPTTGHAFRVWPSVVLIVVLNMASLTTHLAAEPYEEVHLVAAGLDNAISSRDREFVDRFLTADQRKKSGEGTTFDRYLYELSDADLLTEGDACESTKVSIRSVWEILEWFPISAARLVEPLPDTTRGEAAYRIYYVIRGDDPEPERSPTAVATDPADIFIPFEPSLMKYQMRCYISTVLVKGKHGWYSPDLFDYSLFRERFERRELK